MAELTIRPEEIRRPWTGSSRTTSRRPRPARKSAPSSPPVTASPVSKVALGPGQRNELPGVENGTLGIALNLDVREIGVVVLGESEGIEEAGSAGAGHRRDPPGPGR